MIKIRVPLESNLTKISKKKSTTKQKKIRLGAKNFDIQATAKEKTLRQKRNELKIILRSPVANVTAE